MCSRARAGPGESDVRRVDAELVHEMEEAELLVECRILDRGALEAVAQGLVVELDLGRSRAFAAIPVVDQVVVVHRSPAALSRLIGRTL